MRATVFVFICVLGICVAGPSDPQPRTDPVWVEKHERFLANTANNPDIPIIFYGDSITEGWYGNGRSVFDLYYGPLGVANYGISGDRIQHVLWRILNGEVQGLNPKVVVLKIGTNNIGPGRDPDHATADGVINLVATLRVQLPNTKIILLSILPRTGTAYFDSIVAINSIIQNIHDGKNIFYLDMFNQFRGGNVWGVVPSTLFYDGLHLSTAGYVLWAEIMNPLFDELIKE